MLDVGFATHEAERTPRVVRDVRETVFGIFGRCHELRQGQRCKALLVINSRFFANDNTVQVCVLIVNSIVQDLFS